MGGCLVRPPASCNAWHSHKRLMYRMSVLMCQWFAPTKLVVTFEQEGQGRFTEEHAFALYSEM